VLTKCVWAWTLAASECMSPLMTSSVDKCVGTTGTVAEDGGRTANMGTSESGIMMVCADRSS
jgi:hypothetical protein